MMKPQNQNGSRFLLSHRHAPAECGIAFAAWRGFESPLRHGSALGSCPSQSLDSDAEHFLVWDVKAGDERAALAQLPGWIASRTEVRQITEVTIP
jgi:hypothetical protein